MGNMCGCGGDKEDKGGGDKEDKNEKAKEPATEPTTEPPKEPAAQQLYSDPSAGTGKGYGSKGGGSKQSKGGGSKKSKGGKGGGGKSFDEEIQNRKIVSKGDKNKGSKVDLMAGWQDKPINHDWKKDEQKEVKKRKPSMNIGIDIPEKTDEEDIFAGSGGAPQSDAKEVKVEHILCVPAKKYRGPPPLTPYPEPPKSIVNTSMAQPKQGWNPQSAANSSESSTTNDVFNTIFGSYLSGESNTSTPSSSSRSKKKKKRKPQADNKPAAASVKPPVKFGGEHPNRMQTMPSTPAKKC